MQRAALVERYRSYAAKCVELSSNVSDPAGKLVLLEMAHAWLKLAQQVIQSTERLVSDAVPNVPPSRVSRTPN